MRINVFWTSPARSEIRIIKRYYIDTAGINVEEKVFHNIKSSTDILRTHPEVGQEEETLKFLKEGHRYLVKGNYKIIYRMINDAVFITDVFDTRLNPKKLVKRNK